jgi:hypothetical protein
MIRSGERVRRFGASFETPPAAAPQDEDRSSVPSSTVLILRSREAASRSTYKRAAILFAALLPAAAIAHPHSPLSDKSKGNRDHYIELGEAVHGAFGPLIALGIRLGDDAMKTLGVGPRTVDVTYHPGKDAPCACVADGIMLVTTASPGQGTLRVADGAEEGRHGRVVIRHKRSGRAVEYVIPSGVSALVAEAMKGAPERRWTVMMEAPEAKLFARRLLDKAE